jgi:ATP-binding cassette, subfamily G (WHITE), member 1
LTAILGPSGSGKTSLLNVLSAFITKNVSGSVTLNGMPRNVKILRNNSAYIMQEQSLFPLLTVRETMKFAVNFKTGKSLSEAEKRDKIEETLKMLCLYSFDDFVGDLSGGQKKRLSIAVEILHNPQMIFLDECTTGLDSSSSAQLLKHLQQMAKNENRTIVLTIHQPSARLLEMFDHIYGLADGKCVYQGASKNLVPFLKKTDLICPNFYNPYDFLLEMCTNESGHQNIDKFSQHIENGAVEEFRSERRQSVTTKAETYELQNSSYSLSFFNQVCLLLKRNFIFMFRDKTYMRLRILMSVLMGLLIGSLYYQTGREASHMISSFKYLYCSMFFISYSSYFSLMTRCKYQQ